MKSKLLPLSIDHIEIIRKWRNQDFIREMMEFQKYILPEEQLNWFNNLITEQNKYFIISDTYDNYVGLIHLKNITSETAEAGLFIGNPKFIGTGIAYSASLSLLKLAFDDLKLNTIIAKVKKTNHEAIFYNESLGFKIKSDLNEAFLEMEIDKEAYILKSNLLRRLFD